MVEGALTQRRFIVTKSGYIKLDLTLTEVWDVIFLSSGEADFASDCTIGYMGWQVRMVGGRR